MYKDDAEQIAEALSFVAGKARKIAGEAITLAAQSVEQGGESAWYLERQLKLAQKHLALAKVAERYVEKPRVG